MVKRLLFPLIVLFFVLFFQSHSFANEYWLKQYGTSSHEMVNSGGFSKTTDGGFIITGESNTKIFLMKINSDGEIQWQKKYSNANEGYRVIQTSDRGYLVLGVVWQDGKTDLPYTNMLVLKTNSSGEPQWSFKLNKKSQPTSAIEENDGYLISLVYLDSNNFRGALLKLDFRGNIIWVKSYENAGFIDLFKVSDGYVVTGAANVQFEADELISAEVLIGKIDFSGNFIWQKTYGFGVGKKINLLPDGNYLVGSFSFFPKGSSSEYQSDLTLIKISQDGNLMWAKSFGTEGEEQELSELLVENDGYILVGRTETLDGISKGVIIKTDFSGNLIFQKFLEVIDSEVLSIMEKDDYYYFLTILGINFNDVGIIKISKLDLSDTTLCGFLKPLNFITNTRTIPPITISINTIPESTIALQTINLEATNGDLVSQTCCPAACTTPFIDVPCDYWAYNEIVWAKQVGITTGWPDGTYRPEEPVKRDAMAAFFIRALYKTNDPLCEGGIPCGNTQPYFTDVGPEQPFFAHIQKLRELGITRGWPDGTYRPYENIRRDAMAAFLVRAVVGRDDFDDYSRTPYFQDVPVTHPFFKHIQKLRELGITRGCNPPDYTLYCPDREVKRSEMAVFLWRAFGR